MEVYRIKDLNFTYPLMDKKALNNINLIINKGEFFNYMWEIRFRKEYFD